ncbi:lysophospholipid acyltransferase 5 [Battus philenor]|uniref:lysophospholipid acyltransferase 5 n=1 Tax=Battus philenor TaxID=42288 RepID=UPI0035CFC7CF
MLFILMLLGALGLSPIPHAAYLISTTEPALKLLLSILWGYPVAIIYHKYIRQIKTPKLRNMYFILTGIDMAAYNFGWALIHNAIPAFVMFFTNLCFGPGKMNCILTFVFNMTYLLVGYVMTESEDYDITWTMPHCVLTLKLIALSFDLWDGQKLLTGETLSENNKKTALTASPTLIELLGFVYFPACFLVGPIFSFKRYADFTSDKFPLVRESSVYQKKSIQRLVQGIIYLIAFQVGVTIFNVKYMLSDQFWEKSFIYRHFYCGLWAHFALYKYISCWLLTEASCIRFGISYNGYKKNANGEKITMWDGCSNIKLLRFEGATKFQHYIDSFNCNTNHFAAEYIYKRLKFLGNRNLSQLFTLFFLALWHGIRSGYYVTFFNEFLIILMERELEAFLQNTVLFKKVWEYRFSRYAMYILLKMYTIIFMGWSLIPFDLKIISKWWSIYSSLYFSGFVIFLPWAFIYKPLLKHAFKYFNINYQKVQ